MAGQRHNFLRFLTYVRPFTGYLALAVLGGIIKFTVPLLVPQVTRHLLDGVFLNPALTPDRKTAEVLWTVGGMAAVFIFIYAPGTYLRHLFADQASHRAVFRLRCDLYYHILRLSASFFSRNKSGGIVSRLISDIPLAQNLIGSALTNTWMDAAAVAVVLTFLFRIDPATTAVALATFPLYLVCFRRFGAEIRATTLQLQDELATMSGNVSERISASAVVHAFARELHERRKFRRESEKLFSTNMRRIRVQSLNQAVTGVLTSLAPLIVLGYGGYRLIDGRLTPGELVAVTLYLGPLYLPLQRFSELNVVFANSLAALDRIFEIMDEKPEIVSRPDAPDLENPRGAVEFEHVGFGYAADRPVLHDVSLAAAAGQTVALVGHSGSGKSTLVSLIPRFYDVNAGAVRIDGQDVR